MKYGKEDFTGNHFQTGCASYPNRDSKKLEREANCSTLSSIWVWKWLPPTYSCHFFNSGTTCL